MRVMMQKLFAILFVGNFVISNVTSRATHTTARTPSTATTLPASCGERMFDCGDKICIPKTWECDGDNDCLNGNDEKSCDNQKCDEELYYQCKQSSTSNNSTTKFHRISPPSCIPLKWKCDGQADCPEKDDEDGCH